MDSNGSTSTNSSLGVPSFFEGNPGTAQRSEGITTKAFVLNLAFGLGLFAFQVTGFFLLKSSAIGRRIYQPKTYLVQDRLRVEAIPVSPIKWIRRIFTIKSEEFIAKCGLDGYFFIRFIRAMLIIFLPLMAIIVTILLPINYHGGRGTQSFERNGEMKASNVTGLDTLSWQNVAPDQTNRYWAHLVCALLAISWTLYRMQREKIHYIKVRQQFLTSPAHRLRASARTVLVTNIPSEYQSSEALEKLFDVFVDNDDSSRLRVWVNRDFSPLREKVTRLQSLRHSLEKEELKFLRAANKRYQKYGEGRSPEEEPSASRPGTAAFDPATETELDTKGARHRISSVFEIDCEEYEQRKKNDTSSPKETEMMIVEDGKGGWKPAPKFGSSKNARKVAKAIWLRAEIARVTVEIEEMMLDLDNESRFKRQNSAFIQFDRQMCANMACGLISHERPGCMTPRFLDVAPHEIIWKNMGLTSRQRFIRFSIALVLFVGMVIIWGIPATFLGILSQLSRLRTDTPELKWLRDWPSYLISLISGPLTSLLLALLIQLLVPALCRKLAVMVGSPTRSRREVQTQRFYFTFLFIELVLVTSISSGIFATISQIFNNPTSIPNTLAKNFPAAANYFFNYLIIQALGFSGSVLFQYLRILYITTIWPWFTQTPREEAWLQTTIPHQMWANVFSMFTNFAAIGLIYSVIAPLMLIFASAVFTLFWIAYRHNYYYVQRNKIDTHGMLFENALSQLMAGVYVLEITLIGLFFLVRDEDLNVACGPQAIIMIVALVLTAIFHYVMETTLSPLYELIPVTLEDKAVLEERRRFGSSKGSSSETARNEDTSDHRESKSLEISDPDRPDSVPQSPDEKAARREHTEARRSAKMHSETTPLSKAAANARRTLLKLNRRVASGTDENLRSETSRTAGASRKMEMADQLGETIAGYPDELTRLSPEERQSELDTAYSDPVTREPAPVIWIPQDPAGLSEEKIKQIRKYGKYLQYSNSGAYLTAKNKCEITQPAPDVRPDWMLEWLL